DARPSPPASRGNGPSSRQAERPDPRCSIPGGTGGRRRRALRRGRSTWSQGRLDSILPESWNFRPMRITSQPMNQDKSPAHPDISDILARKAEGRREIAGRSFGEKIAAVERLRERLAPLKRAREQRRAAARSRGSSDDQT